jgi:hypothetical protein
MGYNRPESKLLISFEREFGPLPFGPITHLIADTLTLLLIAIVPGAMFAAAAGPDHPVWAMTMSTFVLYL